MSIPGKLVTLGAIEEADLPKLHEWSNNAELWFMLGGWHFPSSLAGVTRWFEGLQTDDLNQRFIIDAANIGPIGTANLVEIDWKNNHAFHGMMIGEQVAQGKGLGLDTIMTIMRYAFDELHLERLDGSMIEYNAASLAIYCDKCNWKIEGRQRNWYFRKGRYWDKIVVGITRDDYHQVLERSHYWEVHRS